MSSESISNEAVYQALRQNIIGGHYPPAARLVETRLARDLGVSRTPVRQALARVAAEGLVQMYPNRGAVVRSFSEIELTQIFDLRAVLEGHAAHEAATRMTPAQLALLEQEVASQDHVDEQAFESRKQLIHFLVHHNHIFHSTIVAASGNQRLIDIVPLVVDMPLQFRSFFWYSEAERQTSQFFHRSIIAALAAKDGDRARNMMQEHIFFGRDFLLKRLAELHQRGEDV